MKQIIQMDREEYDHLAECERQHKKPKDPYQFPDIEWKLDGPVVLSFGHTKMPSKNDCLSAIVEYYKNNPNEPAYFGKSTLYQFMADPTNPKVKRTIHKYEYYVQWEFGHLRAYPPKHHYK